MNATKSIWEIRREKKQKAQAAAVETKKPLNKVLSDEIKSFREKKAEFETTNDRDTYVVLTFSCNKDKAEFLRFLQYKKETFIDGYEFASRIKTQPQKPSVKLRKPLK